MPAVEITNLTTDQKAAGANAALHGKTSKPSSKNGSLNDFLVMVQAAVAEYQQSNKELKANTESNPNEGPKLNREFKPQQKSELIGKPETEKNQEAGQELEIIKNHEKEPKELLKQNQALRLEKGQLLISKQALRSNHEPKENHELKLKGELKKDRMAEQDQEPPIIAGEENFAASEDDIEIAIDKTVAVNHPKRPEKADGKYIKSAGELTQGERETARHADEKDNGGEIEKIAPQAFVAAINIEKLTSKLEALGVDERSAAAIVELLTAGKEETSRPEGIMLGANPERNGGGHKRPFITLPENNNALMATGIDQVQENNNKPENVLTDKGISFREIMVEREDISVEAIKIMTAAKSPRAEKRQEIRSHQGAIHQQIFKNDGETKNRPEINDAKEIEPTVKVKATDVVTGIPNEAGELSVQAVPVRTPEMSQKPADKTPARAKAMSGSFREAAAAILEEKGYSVAEIKGIMNAISEATVSRPKSEARQTSERAPFVPQSFHHQEIMKDVNLGRKNIHADIYKKEASLDDFRQKNVDARIIINPLERQTVKDVPQKELTGKTENTSRSERKNIVAGTARGPEHPKATNNDRKVETQTTEKVIPSRDRDDQGKRIRTAADAQGKVNQSPQEEIAMASDREQSPFAADVLNTGSKVADFQTVKAATDSTRTTYQSVVDQIQDGFALAGNKEGGQVRLALKPEIMGHLDMQIAVRNDTVQIMMTVESEKVHQAMNAHIEDLKTALQNQGLKVDKIEVALQYQPEQERSFYQEQAKSQFNYQGQNSHQGRMFNREQALGDDNYHRFGPETVPKQVSTEGVSIFA